MHSNGCQALRMSIHSGVQERLGGVEKCSAFYLAGIAKELTILQWESWDQGNFIRIPFLIQ